ncbi:MAG: hypothetical protein Q4D06_04080 [Coriobacteriia bacterium]|nr:hypothetical protein [Coriobacteriia bacterium]
MLTAQAMTVRPDRVVCVVQVKPPFPLMTSPELMARVLERFPDLPRHACVNQVGPSFAQVMDHTPTPHLLEHLVIDLQLEQYARMDLPAAIQARPLTGVTQWVNREKGTARVEVGYWDDLVALGCFTRAIELLNQLAASPAPGL